MTRHTLELEKLKVNTGDLLTVWVEARDNRPELGQAGRSQELRIEIVGPVSEQQQQRDYTLAASVRSSGVVSDKLSSAKL